MFHGILGVLQRVSSGFMGVPDDFSGAPDVAGGLSGIPWIFKEFQKRSGGFKRFIRRLRGFQGRSLLISEAFLGVFGSFRVVLVFF